MSSEWHDRGSEGCCATASTPDRLGCLVPQHERQPEDEHGRERETIDAENCGTLHERERIGECVTEDVPREAAKDVAAQPFSGRHCEREQEYAATAYGPKPSGQSHSRGVKECEAGRKQRHGEGQEHRERLGFDQEGLADPE